MGIYIWFRTSGISLNTSEPYWKEVTIHTRPVNRNKLGGGGGGNEGGTSNFNTRKMSGYVYQNTKTFRGIDICTYYIISESYWKEVLLCVDFYLIL